MARVLAMYFASCAFAAAAASCDLAADLKCSSCEMFVEQFLLAANKPVFGTKRDASPRGVYKARISAIYRDHAPEKLRLVDGMLAHYKGREHSLYQKMCYHYGEAIEPAYSKEDAESGEEEFAWKKGQAAKALDSVVEDMKNSTAQWATSGKEGSRKYTDFEKAMSSGNTMDNLSMGGNVKDDLAGCFEHYARAHKSILTSAVAVSKRLYDSGIHKTFCNEIRACGGGDDGGTDDDLGDDVDDDDDEEEEEAEVIDHDEM